MNCIHVWLEQKDSYRQINPVHLDTVIVQGDKGKSWLYSILQVTTYDCDSGHWIAQVHVVFKIPNNKINNAFSSSDMIPSSYLAYVEWFTLIPTRPDPKHQMYKVSRSFLNRQRNAAIIQVELIVCSVHLLSQFDHTVPQKWGAVNVLEECNSFYINPVTDMYSYLTFR